MVIFPFSRKQKLLIILEHVSAVENVEPTTQEDLSMQQISIYNT